MNDICVKCPSWTQMGSDIDGSAADDNLGYSVSMSLDGSTFIVGSQQNDQNGSNSGSARVYSWNGSSWMQKGSTIYGTSAGDLSGWSVGIDGTGNTIAIGSPQNDIGGSNSGQTRVFQWSGSSWTRKGSDILGEASADQSAWSVDLSDNGNVLAIGAVYNDGNGSNSGHVRIYEWNGSSWIKKGSDIDGEAAADQSGYSVNGDGNVVAIGAPQNDGGGLNSGSVRVHMWNGSSWIRKGTDIDGERAGDQSGFSVALSRDGNVLAIGAPFNDGNGNDSGQARVYAWNGSSWIIRGSDIDGEFTGDASGYSVSLNANGSIVAIGAIYNDGGGNNAGQVRVFSWNGSSWVKLGQDIDGENAGDGSGSGRSVSLDGTGYILAVGAPYNDGNGSNSGHVRVFNYA